jgi:hypothetical protein
MVQTKCFLNSQIHFSPTPHNPNFQALGGVCSMLQVVKIDIFHMMTKKLDNVLDLDGVKLHWFSFFTREITCKSQQNLIHLK